jgi:hypothetical protein
MRFRVPHIGTRAVARRNGARLNLDGERILALAAARVLPVLTHPSRPAALSGVTDGACLLFLLAVAQAGPTDNSPAVHKRHYTASPISVT